jgi:hypothetical protein
MKLVSFLTAVFCAVLVNAQENPATALSLTLSDYLANTASGAGCTTTAGNLGASGSGVPTCSGIDNNDVWYQFTATTQAARFNVTTAAFDAVVQVLETGTLNSVACANANGANSGEVLRVNTLTIGASYLLRIHSSNGGGGSFTVCGQFYPFAEVRPTFTPNPATDLGLPGYKVSDQTRRTQWGATQNALVTATRWYFEDVDNGDLFTRQENGSSSILILNSVGGLCYGRQYNVSVEVQTDGYWCGISYVHLIDMEDVPVAVISPTVIGQTYTAAGQINAVFLGSGGIFEWRLTTDNGQTQFTSQANIGSSNLQLSSVPCLRYNRIYTVEVRSIYCDLTGPWSEPGFIFTSTVPYVQIQPQDCNTVQNQGNYINCDFTPNVAQYAWQFAPVEPNDPTLTPIGPAIVVTSPTSILYLLPIGLTPGTTYRVAAKAIFGLNDGCGTPQEGDYGNFCTITMASNGFTAPLEFIDEAPEEWPLATRSTEEFGTDTEAVIAFPNPYRNGMLQIKLPSGFDVDAPVQIDYFSALGQYVGMEQLSMNAGQKMVGTHFLEQLGAGHYIIGLRQGDLLFHTRVVKL